MRIGIDARELCGQPTGVGRYLNGLLAAWTADDRVRGHEFVLYAPESIGVAIDGHRFRTRIVPGIGGSWWEQVQLPRAAARDHLDVFFAPAYSASLLHTVPTVVAIHDLSFVAHPEWFTVREGVRRRWIVRQSAARARAIITISEFSRTELIDRLGVADHRIHVIPPGITPPGITPPGVTLHASLTRVPPQVNDIVVHGARVLYVGSIFNRRHLPDLIRAFAPIARAHARAALDIVGDNRSYPHQDLAAIIAGHALTGRARWRPYVSDDELAALYGAARAFAFLSEYEGLGLTPLEALAAGIPPVLLDTPVARESCGDAALYVAPGDVRAATDALDTLLFDDDERARLLAAAPDALAKYSWPRAASETLTVLEGSA